MELEAQGWACGVQLTVTVDAGVCALGAPLLPPLVGLVLGLSNVRVCPYVCPDFLWRTSKAVEQEKGVVLGHSIPYT